MERKVEIFVYNDKFSSYIRYSAQEAFWVAPDFGFSGCSVQGCGAGGDFFCEPESPFLRRLRVHLFGKQQRKALSLWQSMI